MWWNLEKKLPILSKNKINTELMHNKKYLKAEKKSTQKKAFIVFVNEQYWLIQFIKKWKLLF